MIKKTRNARPKLAQIPYDDLGELEEKGEESLGCAGFAEPPPLPDMHAATTEVKHDIKWLSNRRRVLIAECLNLSFGGDMGPSKKCFSDIFTTVHFASLLPLHFTASRDPVTSSI